MKKLMKNLFKEWTILGIAIIVIIVQSILLKQKDVVISQKIVQINDLKQQVYVLETISNKYNKDVYEAMEINKVLSEQMETLKADNIALASEYDEMKVSYNELKERKELYDNYSYALMYNGERTQLSYDELRTLESLAKEKGINPHVPMAIGMVESKFNKECTTTNSTAKGYFQFLKGTGKFTYNNLMGRQDEYIHDVIAVDPDTSIQLVVHYLDYLYDTRDGNLYQVIKGYSGSPEPSWYIDIMNKYLNKVGLSFDDLA